MIAVSKEAICEAATVVVSQATPFNLKGVACETTTSTVACCE